MLTDTLEIERRKYAEIWAFDDYRKFSPGMENVDRFMKIMKPMRGESLIDIGCGEGYAGLAFEQHGLNVTWLDITDAALAGDVPVTHFRQSSVWGDWRAMGEIQWDYGFCCDVFEHLPPEYVMLSIDRLIKNCAKTWLQICNLPDSFGALIGRPLHLTVRPYSWWRDRLAEVGTLHESRDLCGNSLFVIGK